MVGKICYLVMAFFLMIISGNGWGAEVVGDAPGQRDAAKVEKSQDEEKELKEEALNRYREHFLLWKICHGELVARLGENVKRDRAYSQRVVASLEKMLEVLSPEKKQDLQIYIAQYRQVAGGLGRGLRRARDRKRVKRALDNLQRGIEKKFSYRVVEVRADLIGREKEIIESGGSSFGRDATGPGEEVSVCS